jgi:hypothetical protein
MESQIILLRSALGNRRGPTFDVRGRRSGEAGKGTQKRSLRKPGSVPGY